MTTRHSADSNVQYETRYPLSNDPNDPNKAPNRKRYVVNGRVQCSACKEWKLFEEFHKSKNLAYGICGICKVCARKRASENYFKHKENSKFRNENGEYIKNGGDLIKRYKHKEHKTPDNMKKNWEQNVWLFSNAVGRIQYSIGLFKNKEDAENWLRAHDFQCVCGNLMSSNRWAKLHTTSASVVLVIGVNTEVTK